MKKIKLALRNSKAFIEGMMEVGGIPVTLCKLAADIHTQIQEAEQENDVIFPREFLNDFGTYVETNINIHEHGRHASFCDEFNTLKSKFLELKNIP